MKEIFGPILPIIPYTTLEEAVSFIQQDPAHGLYYFDNNKNAFVRFYLDSCRWSVHQWCVLQISQKIFHLVGLETAGWGSIMARKGLIPSHQAVFHQSRFSWFLCLQGLLSEMGSFVGSIPYWMVIAVRIWIRNTLTIFIHGKSTVENVRFCFLSSRTWAWVRWGLGTRLWHWCILGFSGLEPNRGRSVCWIHRLCAETTRCTLCLCRHERQG